MQAGCRPLQQINASVGVISIGQPKDGAQVTTNDQCMCFGTTRNRVCKCNGVHTEEAREEAVSKLSFSRARIGLVSPITAHARPGHFVQVSQSRVMDPT